MRLSQEEAQIVRALLESVKVSELNEEDFDTFYTLTNRINQMALEDSFIVSIDRSLWRK